MCIRDRPRAAGRSPGSPRLPYWIPATTDWLSPTSVSAVRRNSKPTRYAASGGAALPPNDAATGFGCPPGRAAFRALLCGAGNVWRRLRPHNEWRHYRIRRRDSTFAGLRLPSHNHTRAPVSYTHLDVYKRQPFIIRASASVSRTLNFSFLSFSVSFFLPSASSTERMARAWPAVIFSSNKSC